MYSSKWMSHSMAIVLILCLVKADDDKLEKSHSTSVDGLVVLLQLESDLIENLSNYGDELEKKLKVVRSGVYKMRAESAKAMSQQEEYVSNPLNAFSLIRRMHEDWSEWQAYMDNSVGWSQASYLHQHKDQLPTNNDLEEASEAIHRLILVYDLKVLDMAKGLINGIQYNASLNAPDTYALGQYFQKLHKKRLAKEWLNETSKWLLENTPNTPVGADRGKILNLFASAFIKLKYFSIALPIFDRAVEIANETDDPKLLDERAAIVDQIRYEPNVKPQSPTANSLFDQLCRGEHVVHHKLHCQYKFSGSPFLRLAPIKMELILLDPEMVVFYDVLSPYEVSEIQTIARSHLGRTMVFQHGKNVVNNQRTSKGFWLNHYHNNLTIRIKRRINDMTDLVLDGSESLQIMNYGIGGHYNIHHDYFNVSKEKLPKANGERIATVLFYLKKVGQGGATAFPNLLQAVRPQAGMALLWYNLHRDGTPNARTLHGGCPVLVGSKWVMSQWISADPQLFTRPCLKSENTRIVTNTEI